MTTLNPKWSNEYVAYNQLKRLLLTPLSEQTGTVVRAWEWDRHGPSDRGRPRRLRCSEAAQAAKDEEFMQRLTSEIAKVDAFYTTRLRNSQATFNLLEESAGSGAPANDLASRDLQNRLVKFYVELTALREYASLNYTAVTKIVKKHDKYAPAKIAATFRTDLNSRPVFGTLEEVHTLLARTRVCSGPPQSGNVGASVLFPLIR